MAKDFISKWNGKQLTDDGAYVSKDFNSFQNAFKKEVSSIAENANATLVKYSKGHYDMSGFIERNGHYVYFNYSNYRNRSCVNLTSSDVLYMRTAANDKDYTGGRNHHVPFTSFYETLNKLLDTEHIK